MLIFKGWLDGFLLKEFQKSFAAKASPEAPCKGPWGFPVWFQFSFGTYFSGIHGIAGTTFPNPCCWRRLVPTQLETPSTSRHVEAQPSDADALQPPVVQREDFLTEAMAVLEQEPLEI